MKYVAYDYEEPGEPENFWHIYSLDNDAKDTLRGANTLVEIKGPNNGYLEAAVAKIAEAIDAAVALAESL